MQTSPVKINRLQHVGIPVFDIIASEAFYSRLGFQKVMDSIFSIDGETGLCFMMQNESVTIELYQMPETKRTEIRNRKDGHIDHIAFDVDDVDAVFDSLKEASFRIVEGEPVFFSFWKNGCKYFNILGPDGERLELTKSYNHNR